PAFAGMTEEFQTVIPAPAFTGVNSCRNLPIKLSKINVMAYYYKIFLHINCHCCMRIAEPKLFLLTNSIKYATIAEYRILDSAP
ncbi:hypothetical protein KKE26_11455, partial [bacterium]|nr:hypothetical protein [bacterium]